MQTKFRAWHKEFGRFLSKEEYCLDFDGKLIFVEFNHQDKDDFQVKLIAVNPKLYTIQQSTGILDKNNKEIFEGDILHITMGELDNQFDPFQEIIKPVFWNKDRFTFNNESLFPYNKQAMIIGNIFENAYLLK